MSSGTGCRGWVCQFELGELNIFLIGKIKKIYYSEETGETTLRPTVEQVTEESNEKELESPNGGIGIWLLTGLAFGILVCLGVGLKKAWKWCKKGTLFNFILFHSNVFYFQIERVST